MFTKILVANRAEIAVRVIRTCRELGIKSVAVYSDPDEGALHVREADETVHLPGTSAAETYLDSQKIIDAAKSTGAQAVHPGYGFLAENADFAQALADADLVYVGPSAQAITIMGEKVAARQVAAAADVPQVPGSKGAINSAAEVIAFGDAYGYPVAIKASYGGGGRGMRTVGAAADAEEAFQAARRESEAAFGRGDVYLERYIENARHIEVQIFADTHGNIVWLGDRDCSVQRRHQKLIEEAPAPGLSQELRIAMGEASVRLAQAVDYVGAGTVEFLVEVDREAFYFLEMNTRIQVEHPVTEATLGLDLIAEQLRVAAGEQLSISGSGVPPRGHAIEVRVNAEDVTGGAFRPSPGKIMSLRVPARAGVRFDAGYEAGDEVLPYYDSLIGKLIVWAPTRAHAIERTLACLDDFDLTGVPTTLTSARVILGHADFRAARIGTRWLENVIDIAALLPPAGGSTPDSCDDEDAGDEYSRQEVWVGGRRYLIPLPLLATPGPLSVAAPDTAPGRTGGGTSPRPARKAVGASGTITSPMQGTVVKVAVTEGQVVALGDLILVMEAMKMENPIRAPFAGAVTVLSASAGQVVPAGTVLAQITPSEV